MAIPATSVSELVGSRTEGLQNNMKTGKRIFASNGPMGGDLPWRGESFIDAENTTESGVTGRKCRDISTDNKLIPGIWIVECMYIGAIGYSEAEPS